MEEGKSKAIKKPEIPKDTTEIESYKGKVQKKKKMKHVSVRAGPPPPQWTNIGVDVEIAVYAY